MASGVITAGIFVLREKRAPTTCERHALATLSLLASWVVSLAALALLLATIGTAADWTYFQRFVDTVPIGRKAAVIVGACVVLYGLLWPCYGPIARNLSKYKA